MKVLFWECVLIGLFAMLFTTWWGNPEEFLVGLPVVFMFGFFIRYAIAITFDEDATFNEDASFKGESE